MRPLAILARTERLLSTTLPGRGRQRSIHTSFPNHRNPTLNYLSKYAPRADLLATPRQPPPSTSPSDPFLTVSTHPVAPSIQEVPSSSDAEHASPGADGHQSSKKAIPIEGQSLVEPVPAMKDVPPKPKARTDMLVVEGVEVPPKPTPPGEEECCMSGCVNCVYTLYADSLLEYNDALRLALTALRTSHTPRSSWPQEIQEYYARKKAAKKGKAGVDDGGAAMFGRASGKAIEQEDAALFDEEEGEGEVPAEDETKEQMKTLMEGVDPSLRAFLEMEAKMKAKKQ